MGRRWHQNKEKQADRSSRGGEDKAWALESLAQVTCLDAVMGTQQDWEKDACGDPQQQKERCKGREQRVLWNTGRSASPGMRPSMVA